MKMDLTIKITRKMVTDAQVNEKKALVGIWVHILT